MSYEPHPPTNPQTNQPVAAKPSNLFSILAIVFGVIAILFLPIVFGIAAIVLGAIAVSKKEPLAKIGLTVAIVGTVAGFVLGAIVYNSMN